MGMRKIIKMFKNGSVCVVGQRGRGKDMLIGNVIARRKEQYHSNVNYNCHKSSFIQLDFKGMQLSHNTPFDLVDGKIKPYTCPYMEGADIYISDVGVYFPSQECNELVKRYRSMPLFLALSRQLSNSSVHYNCQNLGRIWDKMREQSDQYILCEWCKVWKNWVLQSVIIYDRADSCQARIKPCRISTPLMGSGKTDVRIYKDNFYNQHGEVKRMLLFYRNKSKYDTRIFKSILGSEKQ